MQVLAGRFAQLRALEHSHSEVTADHGVLRQVVGPGRVGKSRLVHEHLRRQSPRYLHHVAERLAGASRADGNSHRAHLARALAPLLPEPGDLDGADTWPAVWGALAAAARHSGALTVVIDNADSLAETDSHFVSTLATAWQTELARLPILLLAVGRRELRDLTRAAETAGVERSHRHRSLIELEPFSPRELVDILDLAAADAIEVRAVSGGHADIVAQWPLGAGVSDALPSLLDKPASMFAARAALQRLDQDALGTQAQAVLAAAAAGAHSRAELGRSTGLPPASLDRALKALTASGDLAVHRPLSTRASREARYRPTDSYLTWWLHWYRTHHEELARGDSDEVIQGIRRAWPQERGLAALPEVRKAMDRLADRGMLPGTAAVGGYWNRFEDLQVDLVGVDAGAAAVTFVGSVKWRDGVPFDHYDLAELITARAQVAGATDRTPLVAVSVAGSVTGAALAAELGPEELLSAWD